LYFCNKEKRTKKRKKRLPPQLQRKEEKKIRERNQKREHGEKATIVSWVNQG